MMKKIVWGGIWMLSTFVCAAQKITQEQFFLSKGLVDVQYGISIPVGDYALSDFTLPAGYAQNGYSLKLGLNYDLAPYIGFAIQYQYTQNSFNSGNLLSDLRENNRSDDVYNSYTSDPWKLQGMLLGVYYPLKATRTTIDIKVLGGIFTGTLPECEENVTVPSLNYLNFNIKQLETKASNLGFQLGLKFRYQLYKKLVLSSSIDYTQATINFEDIRLVETNSHQSFSGEDYSQKFQFFTFAAGIGIQFD
jgi:opacity protein-like surface antigen